MVRMRDFNLTGGVLDYYHYYADIRSCMLHMIETKNMTKCEASIGLYKFDYAAMFMLQGAIHHTVRTDTADLGTRYTNGTWSGILGQIQAGVIDTWIASATLSAERWDDFGLSTPYSSETCGALLARKPLPLIDVEGLTARVEVSVYALYVLVLIVLNGVYWMNERWISGDEENSMWAYWRQMFPGNAKELPAQCGVTRKVLCVTVAFAILLGTAYYQSYLLQSIVIPKRPAETSVSELAHMIVHNHSRPVFLYKNDAIERELMKATTGPYLLLKQAIEENTPLYLGETNDDEWNVLEKYPTMLIDQHNVVHLSTMDAIYVRLEKLPPERCGDYEIIQFSEMPPFWTSLIVRHGRRDLLELFNQLVAQRGRHVDEVANKIKLKKECQHYLMPSIEEPLKYVQINIRSLSGVFTLLLVLLFISSLALAAEVYATRGRKYVYNMEVHARVYQVELHLKSSKCYGKVWQRERIREQFDKLLTVVAEYCECDTID